MARLIIILLGRSIDEFGASTDTKQWTSVRHNRRQQASSLLVECHAILTNPAALNEMQQQIVATVSSFRMRLLEPG